MIHGSVRIHPSARINCKHLSIGEGGSIGANCVIEGNNVEIGRQFWMDEDAVIGGGSCFDPMAFLKAGDFLHMGRNSQLNIARGIEIGDEVGIGIQTQVFTHGAYLSELDGFPVQFEGVKIGSRVWLPNAWVNPGVTLGGDIVVASRSLVNTNIPSGSLAAGSPAKILKEGIYPKKLTFEQKSLILKSIANECNLLLSSDSVVLKELSIIVSDVVFDCENKEITGLITPESEVVRNQLRRHGVRFYFSNLNQTYTKW